MTIEDVEKINKIRKLPFKDAMFVRFLKEKNALSQYVREIKNNRQETTSFQLETANVKEYLKRFEEGKNYILDGFPCGNMSTTGIDWFHIDFMWKNTL